MKVLSSIIFIFALGNAFSFAKENQEKQTNHPKNENHKDADDPHEDDDHKHSANEKDSDEHKDEHDHEEENSSVGPDKGITLFSETDGFKLSTEAVKNFELQTLKLVNVEPWTVPSSAILYSGEEINIYRLRSGFYKRIDFSVISKSAKEIKIKSPDLSVNDEIVTQGIAFLRSAEIVATGGAPEGHSH